MDFDKTLRREIKFVANVAFLIQIDFWIAKTRLLLKKHYDDRMVNNIYYDTYACKTYADNLDGISERSKLRYRWYGTSLSPSNGAIELKKRKNACGTKKTKIIQGVNNNETHNSLISKIRDAVDETWLPALNYYSTPIVLNQYMRSYYISNCERFRVTLDRKHSVFDQRMSKYINIRKKANTSQYLVLEIKFHPDLSDCLSSMIGDIPMRISRNSKYINSVNSII